MRKRGKLRFSAINTTPVPLLYVLAADGRTPVPASGAVEWSQLTLDLSKRKVATDRFSFHDEQTGLLIEFLISTVFTGASVTAPGLVPEVFETLVSRWDREASGKVLSEESEVEYRWKAWDIAAEGHDAVVESIFSTFRKDGVTAHILDSYHTKGRANGSFRDRREALPLPFDSLRKLLDSRIIRS